MSRLKKESGVVAACITGSCSIIGSLIVAIVVSYISRESTLEAVRLANEKDKIIAEKNLALQKEQHTKTLDNQFEVLNITAKNNLELVNQTFKRNKEIQEIEYKNQEKASLEKENRDLKLKTQFATQYLTSDIISRINLLERTLSVLKKDYNDASYKIDQNDTPVKIIMKTYLMTQSDDSIEITVYPVEWDIVFDNIQKLTRVSTLNTINFYRSVGYLKNYLEYKKKRIENVDSLKRLENILLDPSKPDNFKKEAVNLFYSSLYTMRLTEMRMIGGVIINGYQAVIDLKESVKADTKNEKSILETFTNNYKFLDDETEGNRLLNTLVKFTDSLEEVQETGKKMGTKTAETKE